MPGRQSTTTSRPPAGRKQAAGRATSRKHRGGDGATAANLPLLRTSERSTFNFCRFQWWLSYELKRKPDSEAPALTFGTLVHAALAEYYQPGVKRGPHPAKTLEQLYAKMDDTFMVKVGGGEHTVDDAEGKWQDAGEFGVLLMEQYVERWGADDEWEVLVTEQPFRMVVHHPVTGEPWFMYAGVMDGVWRHRPTKRIWIADHKTTSSLGGTEQHPKIPPHLVIDDQAGAYWSHGVEWLVEHELLKRNQKLAGMNYNFIKKAMPDDRPFKLMQGKPVYLNKDGSVSKRQGSPRFARIAIQRDVYDREQAKLRAIEDYREIEMVRAGELSIKKMPSQFKCGMCSYRDICELHEVGADWEGFMKSTTKTWDPYAEHEIYAGR